MTFGTAAHAGASGRGLRRGTLVPIGAALLSPVNRWPGAVRVTHGAAVETGNGGPPAHLRRMDGVGVDAG